MLCHTYATFYSQEHELRILVFQEVSTRSVAFHLAADTITNRSVYIELTLHASPPRVADSIATSR
jgi:hypothetical protein